MRTLKLQPRPDLGEGVLSIFGERFPHLTREEIMVIAGIPAKELRHTRAAQERIAADPYARPGPAWGSILGICCFCSRTSLSRFHEILASLRIP